MSQIASRFCFALIISSQFFPAWNLHSLYAQVHFTDPHAGLAIHGTADTAELGQLAAQIYKSVNEDLGKWVELGNKNKLDAEKPADVAKMFVQIQQIGRAGRRLSIFGEPAGGDYLARQVYLSSVHSKLFETYKGSKVAQTYANLCRAQLAKTAPARAKVIESVRKLVDAKKFFEAEKQLDEAMDDLDSIVIYLTPDEVAPVVKPLYEMRYYVDAPAKQLRVEAAQKSLIAARDNTKLEGVPSLMALHEAALALKSAATVTIDGQSVTGPQLVALLDKTLTAEHASMLRRRAIEMARVSAADQQSESVERKDLEEKYAALHKDLIALLPSIITADATRSTEAEAPALYEQHLTAVAPILLKKASDTTKEEVRKALLALAHKSPALSAEVAAEEATSAEYLRWKKRVAAAQAKAKSAEFVPVAKVFAEGTACDPMTLSDGLFNNTPQFQCAFYGATPRIIAAAQPRITGKSVSVGAAFPIESSAGRSAVTRYSDRTIAMVALPDLAPQATALQTQLLGEGKSPKSLEAALAIESTSKGWLRGAGGVVEDMYLEALLTRFAKTPESLAHLTPLGAWNQEPAEPLMRHAVGRFVIKPAWYQGDYYFATSP